MNRIFSFLLLFALLFSAIGSPVQAAQVPETGENLLPTDAAKADVWCVAGGFQGWNNSSHPMYDDATHGDLLPGDGVFSLEQAISAAGRYEFKVYGCGTWDGYPTTNAWFNTSSAGQTVRFTFDTNNHGSDAGPAYAPTQNIVNLSGETTPTSFTAAGDFQGWDNANPATLMTNVGPGLYRLSYVIAAPGTYMYKAVATGTWDAFSSLGRSTDSAPLNFTTTVADQEVIFLLDVYSGRILALLNQPHAGSWCVGGALNGWNASGTPLYDDGTSGDLLGNDGIFSADVLVPTAGRYEFKVTNCTWDYSLPGSGNSWLITSTDNRTVKFTFDTNNHSLDVGPDYLPATNVIQVWDDLTTAYTLTAAGSFQGWDNANLATLMTSVGGGLYQYNYTALATQTYSGKVVQTGFWDGFGGDGRSINATNIDFNATIGQIFYTVFDVRSGRMVFFPGVVPETHASHDNSIWWADLGHESRSDTYRTPGGSVTMGTEVTLRLRAAAGDLTGARVRIWNDRTNTQSLLNMSLAATDDTYEWWQVTLPASADPTVYWYRFIAMDGTATAYYEDDAARDGGWGAVFDTSPDNSYQLTIYDTAYHTPDWVKNAVVYQVFPDRFHDGNTTNDTPAGTFFYDEAGGTIYRSTSTDWNTYVCDPRQTGTPCTGTYSKNFYGGDIQGLIDKLDYLQGLGVTAIYLNPIFASPSNHGYDTTNYLQIDPSMGDQVLLEQLATDAHNRGMYLILDGVFNHVSSDSVYFDRYSRYSEVGACESSTSPYRTWFYFTDVTPGTGTCAGSDGTPLAATYTSWWGYDSLPKLNSSLPAVRDLVYSDGTNSVAPFWMQWADGWRLDVGGDVDPGVLSDPANTYWEEFRTAVHAVNPDAYILGEEWGNGTSWLLGDEWDAVMNYQFSTAALGFWRDTTFTDNDHSTGSSAGPINPLTPSQFESKMRSLEERYPPEAFQAMLNLFGSHDTSRALFMLDENADLNDPSLYTNPNYDWSDAITRLKGAVILQMTLPGAPTIYYGDEVGLVGPMAYSGGKWEDDPYNRQPYPWLDESGTPYYTHLQSQVSQDALYDYYADLTEARNDHPALRTGDYRTLLVDDANGLYAFGRRLFAGMPILQLEAQPDAAVVVVNQDTASQPVVLDVAGYLPYGSTFTDVLSGTTFTVSPSGQISLPAVPARSGMVLVLQSGAKAVPPVVNTLAVTAEGNGTLDLGWTALPMIDRYRIYRSILSGGGYEYIGETTTSTYHDTGLTNAVKYYYVIVSVDDDSGLVSSYSNEDSGIPHPAIGWSVLQWPPTITHTIGTTPTENIYGRIWVDGVTSAAGQGAGILAQVGYGADGSDPSSTNWNWWDAVYNADDGNNDEYRGTLLPEAIGSYDYAYRFSSDGGNSWVYADLDGSPNGYQTTQAGALTVIGSTDTTAPSAPVLSISDWGAEFISLAWTEATDNVGIYAYDIYRSQGAVPPSKIDRVYAPDLTYIDTNVITGATYTYHVEAIDTSFNHSSPSNTVSQDAEPKIVSVTLNLTVPDFTPVGDTIYFTRYINLDGTLGEWNPAATAMIQVDATHWTLNFNLLDGTLAAFKFTRGDWETVIKGADGNEELPDLTFTTNYGTTGLQTVDFTVLNWRDPIVTTYSPLDGALNVDQASLVQVTFSQAMNPAGTFAVKLGADVVPGTFSYDAATYTFTFTPAEPLWRTSTYTVTVTGMVDFGGDVQQNPVTFSFSTTPLRYYLPIISNN